jgi:hypothetical protein
MKQIIIICAGLLALLRSGSALEVMAKAHSSASQVQPLQSSSASARTSALGGAFVAVADGAEGLGHNPAGLGFEKRGSLALGHNTLLLGSFQDALFVSLPLGPSWGGLGVRADYVDYGSMKVVNSQGQSQGELRINETRAGLGWGGCLWEPLSVGFGLKAGQQRFGELAETSYGLEGGALLKPMPNVGFGIAAHGAGGPAADGKRYWDVRGGAMASMPFSQVRVLGSLEALFDQGDGQELRVGTEVTAYKALALRGGIRAGLYGGAPIRYSAGAGFGFSQWSVDYAWLPGAGTESFHQLGLRWQFGSEEAKAIGKAIPASAAADLGPPPLATPRPVSAPQAASITAQEAAKADAMHGDVLSIIAGRAKALEVEGKNFEALALYRQGVAENATDIHCWRGLAKLYDQMGNAAKAQPCWQQVHALDAQAADANARLALPVPGASPVPSVETGK